MSKEPRESAPAPGARDAAPSLDLERFSVGLLALLFYLGFEAIDVTIVGFDVLYDGVGALLLLFVARCIDQPAVRAYGAPSWAVWGAAATRLAGAVLALPLISSLVPDVVVGALSLVHLAALVAVSVTLRMVCAGRGLASSARWRRVTVLFVLTLLVPAVAGAALGNWPRVGLPLRFSEADGLLVASTGIALYVLSLLALVDAALATVVTLRSSRRRA
ncbi:MAG: hypothetical protein R3F49_03615 [Planctomycetota bacterium]